MFECCLYLLRRFVFLNIKSKEKTHRTRMTNLVFMYVINYLYDIFKILARDRVTVVLFSKTVMLPYGNAQTDAIHI